VEALYLHSGFGSQFAVDIDVKQGTIAFVFQAQGAMVTVHPLSGTAAAAGNVPQGYLVVLPTSQAQA
jgi:prephenate dehydrogenase